jgi:hypothetical protein
MRPHIHIGTIGHVDHGKTTLTAAITNTLANSTPPPLIVRPDTGVKIETAHVEYHQPAQAPVVMDVTRRPKLGATGLLMLTAALGGLAMPGFRYAPSARSIRNDPHRPKTPEDLARMEAAQRKRDRKAARRNAQNATAEPRPTITDDAQ